jgi:hypothetical protein
VLDDGEAEAGASFIAGAPLVHPVEALEDAGEGLGRDADAGVLDLQDGLGGASAGTAALCARPDREGCRNVLPWGSPCLMIRWRIAAARAWPTR